MTKIQAATGRPGFFSCLKLNKNPLKVVTFVLYDLSDPAGIFLPPFFEILILKFYLDIMVAFRSPYS